MIKLLIACFAVSSPLLALDVEEFVWENTGPSVQEYNSALLQAVASNDSWSVIDYAEHIANNFPSTPFAQDAPFLTGEAYFKLDQLEHANRCFTDYLQHVSSPKHFEMAVEYKFNIAEKFAGGG